MERTKKHPTKSKTKSSVLYVLDNDIVYAIPKKVAEKYVVEAKQAISRPDNVTADHVFAEFDGSGGKAASLLKGLRLRENLSQVKFAKRIGVTQSNLSKMESGVRPIGKTIAKRIADKFEIDYRYLIT